MAGTTTLRKQRLDAERQALKARVAQLRRRLEADRNQVQEEASRLVGRDSPLAEHPRELLAGSAAVGFLVGKTSPPVPHPNLSPVVAAREVTGKGTETIVNALKVEAGLVIRDFVSGLLGADDEEPRTPDGRL